MLWICDGYLVRYLINLRGITMCLCTGFHRPPPRAPFYRTASSFGTARTVSTPAPLRYCRSGFPASLKIGSVFQNDSTCTETLFPDCYWARPSCPETLLRSIHATPSSPGRYVSGDTRAAPDRSFPSFGRRTGRLSESPPLPVRTRRGRSLRVP